MTRRRATQYRSMLPALDWRLVAWSSVAAALAVPNAILLGEAFRFMATREYVWDWWLIEQAVARIGTGTVYQWGDPAPLGDVYAYRYSPLFAYLMAPFTLMGLWFWRALHLVSLLLLPPKLAGLALLLWPFWFDVAHGNVMTFVMVSGFLALQGSRFGTAAYFAVALLVPRPLMIPLAVWILWKRPVWRVPVGGMVIVYAALTLATGEGVPFLASVLRAGDMLTFEYNWAPSAIIGVWWIAIGGPLAIWLTLKSRVGWAALAISPYILPYYLLVLLWEIRPSGAEAR